MRISWLRSIVANPESSIQDAVLAVGVLATGLLLAIEFDLFQFAHELTTEERKISLIEAIALTVLLGLCMAVFILRRVREEGAVDSRQAEVDAEIRVLRDQAMRDPLTGLYNRRAVVTRLKALSVEGEARPCAFFLLDLDGFKQVNDRCGHAAGDNVLQVIAERFRHVTRPDDLLARLGGDEFAVLAYDVDKSSAAAVGRRFAAALDNEVCVDGVGHSIGVSIGAVLIPQDCESVEDVLAFADLAMYRAKATEKSAVIFYGDVDRGAGYSRA